MAKGYDFSSPEGTKSYTLCMATAKGVAIYLKSTKDWGIDTALCALTELEFLLRAALCAALNKNSVPHSLEKCYKSNESISNAAWFGDRSGNLC